MLETRVWSLGQKISWRRKWQPTPVFLPGESHGRRSLVGYSPWGRKELDMTEWLHTLTHTRQSWFQLVVAQMVKHLPTVQETRVQSLGREDPLEKEMVTHSGILAWRIPRTEKPIRLQSIGSQRVRHNWATSPSPYCYYLADDVICILVFLMSYVILVMTYLWKVTFCKVTVNKKSRIPGKSTCNRKQGCYCLVV